MDALEKIFGKRSGVVIGALHLPPLPGYPDFPGYERSISDALLDADALVAGGVDGIIFENNYDVPHTLNITREAMEAMLRIGAEIKASVRAPVGVSVLWNDYRSALTIAKKLDLQFIRVPVFVDTVKTDYGTFVGDAAAVVNYRKSIDAEAVAIFTDIHVKHAALLTPEPISAVARRAINAGADVLIVTGKWTGDAPDFSELQAVRETIGDFPSICGSGVDEDNISKLFEYANGAIVSTSLKDGEIKAGEVNLKSFDQRINQEKTKRMVTKASLSTRE